jgi:acyl-CoA thioester hydrolase
MSTLLWRHRLTVRFRDCDQLGHVNHAVYLTYLEQARFTFWRAHLRRAAGPGGADRPDPRGRGVILARVEVDYRAQARAGDDLEVRVMLDRIGRSSFGYAYEIANVVTGQLIAQAKSVLVRFDYDAQKPVAIEEDFRVQIATPLDE